MGENLFFSVIVPVFNSERYIGRCIDSILAQTFKNFELVIVDDFSSDRSYEICSMYADDRIVLVHLEENGGVVHARDVGLERSKGKYICWVDADDHIAPKRLETFYDVIEKESVDVINAGWVSVDCHGRQKKVRDSIPCGIYKGDCYSSLKPHVMAFDDRGYNRNISPNVWAKCAKRKLYMLTVGCIDSSLRIGDDSPRTYINLLAASSLAVLDDYSYFYVANPSQMTRRRYYADYYIRAAGIYDLIERLNRENGLCKDDISVAIRQNLCHVGAFGVLQEYENKDRKSRNENWRLICSDFERRGLCGFSYGFHNHFMRIVLQAMRTQGYRRLHFLSFLYHYWR